MKNKIIVFAILIIVFITSIQVFTTPNAKSNTVFTTERKKVTPGSSFTGHLTYVRVYKDGIWYIYVYDGGELVDVYPE